MFVEDSRRLTRLCAGGPLSITRLTTDSAVTRQAITKHLQILADAGLVHDIRQGRERIWALDTDQLDEARRYLDGIARQGDEALGRLKAFVEDDQEGRGKHIATHST